MLEKEHSRSVTPWDSGDEVWKDACSRAVGSRVRPWSSDANPVLLLISGAPPASGHGAHGAGLHASSLGSSRKQVSRDQA